MPNPWTEIPLKEKTAAGPPGMPLRTPRNRAAVQAREVSPLTSCAEQFTRTQLVVFRPAAVHRASTVHTTANAVGFVAVAALNWAGAVGDANPVLGAGVYRPGSRGQLPTGVAIAAVQHRSPTIRRSVA